MRTATAIDDVASTTVGQASVLRVGELLLWAEEQPQLCRRATWISTYKLTRPRQPTITERVRWSVATNLERIDVRRSTSIFDRKANVVTRLNDASRTYRKLEAAPRQLMEP